jgi:hypothetical protein
VVHPKGVRERFNTWGLHEVFGSWAAFVLESQEHQFEGLKAEVEDLRFDPGIAGYVITELTDVHWETNGLLGTGRTPKRLHERFAEVNGPVAVVGRPERTRYRSGDRAVIDVVVAPASAVGEPLVVWGVDELGLAGTVRAPGRIVFEIPPLQAPLTVTVRLRLADRAEVIRNETKLWLFPSDRRTGPRDVPIVRRLDEVAGAVADGGRAIVVATDEDALPRGASVRLERWDPDDDATGWHRASGLGWLHPAITTELPVGPRVDLAFLGLTADHRLRGYAPERHADVLAGHYLGWIRDVTASIAAFRYGRGSGIVCTFPLLEVDGVDPLATALLDRLAWLVADRGFTADTVL